MDAANYFIWCQCRVHHRPEKSRSLQTAIAPAAANFNRRLKRCCNQRQLRRWISMCQTSAQCSALTNGVMANGLRGLRQQRALRLHQL